MYFLYRSCGAVDIPIDNDLVDAGLEEILAALNKEEELKAFDLVLSKLASSSAKKYGIEIGLGEIALPVEIDFKETLIKKLPQILMYCILKPEGNFTCRINRSVNKPKYGSY